MLWMGKVWKLSHMILDGWRVAYTTQIFRFHCYKFITEVDYGHIVNIWWRRRGLENWITEYCQFHHRYASNTEPDQAFLVEHFLKLSRWDILLTLIFKAIRNRSEDFLFLKNFNLDGVVFVKLIYGLWGEINFFFG